MMVDRACMQARMGQDVVVASSGGGFEPLLRRHGITIFRCSSRVSRGVCRQ